MGNFITKFDTTSEYESAKDGLLLPHVSLTKDTMLIHYDKFVEKEYSYIPLRIWVDDFDGDLVKEIPDFVADPNDKQSDSFNSINQIMTIDGVDYCMWENTGLNSGWASYLLTTTYDYDTLYAQSLEQNNSNEFTAYYAVIKAEDDELYHVLDTSLKLIKVEKI